MIKSIITTLIFLLSISNLAQAQTLPKVMAVYGNEIGFVQKNVQVPNLPEMVGYRQQYIPVNCSGCTSSVKIFSSRRLFPGGQGFTGNPDVNITTAGSVSLISNFGELADTVVTVLPLELGHGLCSPLENLCHEYYGCTGALLIDVYSIGFTSYDYRLQGTTTAGQVIDSGLFNSTDGYMIELELATDCNPTTDPDEDCVLMGQFEISRRLPTGADRVDVTFEIYLCCTQCKDNTQP